MTDNIPDETESLVMCQICLTALEYEQLHALLTETKRKWPDSSDWIGALLTHMGEAQKEAQRWEADDQADDEDVMEALRRG